MVTGADGAEGDGVQGEGDFAFGGEELEEFVQRETGAVAAVEGGGGAESGSGPGPELGHGPGGWAAGDQFEDFVAMEGFGHVQLLKTGFS